MYILNGLNILNGLKGICDDFAAGAPARRTVPAEKGLYHTLDVVMLSSILLNSTYIKVYRTLYSISTVYGVLIGYYNYFLPLN